MDNLSFQLYKNKLGHTKLIYWFMDFFLPRYDQAGRGKKKKKFQASWPLTSTPRTILHYADQDLPLLAALQTHDPWGTTVAAPLFTVTESHPVPFLRTILIDHTHLKDHTHFNFIFASRE
jgi:hypothetical protein